MGSRRRRRLWIARACRGAVLTRVCALHVAPSCSFAEAVPDVLGQYGSIGCVPPHFGVPPLLVRALLRAAGCSVRRRSGRRSTEHCDLAKQLIYNPRHVSLQRISAILRMPITNVGMRSESAGRRGRLIVSFPPRMPGGQYENHEFIGDVMPTEFAAIENVAERALDFLRTVKHVNLDDVNYKLLAEAEQKLAMAEPFHTLHMEVAQKAQQLTQSLIQEVEEISHAHDTLLWLNADLQQQNEVRENQQAQTIQQLTLQNGELTQEKAALQQQCALITQQIEALTQKNVGQGQDLENTSLQLQLSLQENMTLHQAHVALQHAYAVLQHAHDGLQQEHGSLQQIHAVLEHDHGGMLQRHALLHDRYNDAINIAEFMADRSAGFLPLDHRKGRDTSGKPIIVPFYAGSHWPPKVEAEHLANAVVKLAIHRLETDRLLH